MTYSYVTWLIHTWREIGETVYRCFLNSFTHDYSHVTWLIHIWYDLFICFMTHSYVAGDWRDCLWVTFFWTHSLMTIQTYHGSFIYWSKEPPPSGGFPIYYVPSSRTVCKRTPLEEFVPSSSRGVLLHTVLDEGHLLLCHMKKPLYPIWYHMRDAATRCNTPQHTAT